MLHTTSKTIAPLSKKMVSSILEICPTYLRRREEGVRIPEPTPAVAANRSLETAVGFMSTFVITNPSSHAFKLGIGRAISSHHGWVSLWRSASGFTSLMCCIPEAHVFTLVSATFPPHIRRFSLHVFDEQLPIQPPSSDGCCHVCHSFSVGSRSSEVASPSRWRYQFPRRLRPRPHLMHRPPVLYLLQVLHFHLSSQEVHVFQRASPRSLLRRRHPSPPPSRAIIPVETVHGVHDQHHQHHHPLHLRTVCDIDLRGCIVGSASSLTTRTPDKPLSRRTC